jgi:hypothetical protein
MWPPPTSKDELSWCHWNNFGEPFLPRRRVVITSPQCGIDDHFSSLSFLFFIFSLSSHWISKLNFIFFV